jgi:hypothetical protein
MKFYIALAALVLLAGCVGDELPAAGGGGQQPAGTGDKTGSDEVTVYLNGLPDEVSGTEYFTIVVEANEDVEDARVFLYNLGSYLESSCSGTNSLGSIAKGQRKDVSCSLRATDTPLGNVTQEIMFEADFKVSKYSGEAGVKVYDGVEFDRLKPGEGAATADLGVGTLSVAPGNVREGEDMHVTIELDGDLSTGDDCGCNIETVMVKIPRGFSISGDSGWTRASCGNFNCYQKSNVDVPFSEDMTLSIAGVTRTETFYIGAEIDGIWKVERGSGTVVIPV